MTKKAVIISGFPGVGKTYYTQNADLNILDSDSSKFSWIKEGVRNTSFPKNYIEHIRKNIDKVDVILVSSHKVVRDALVDNGIHFILVYPDRSLKEEYIKRFQDRGSNSNFINMIDKNWNSFIDDIENSDEYKTIKLESGKFLNDLLNIDDFRGKWSSGEVICLKCGYIWGVVAPIDVCEMFECPECSLMFGHFRYPYALNEGEEVYLCDCGSESFQIARDYYLCMVCGTKHWREDVW